MKSFVYFFIKRQLYLTARLKGKDSIKMHNSKPHVTFKTFDHDDSRRVESSPSSASSLSHLSHRSRSPLNEYHPQSRVSTAIVIIGDEILKGQVTDSNSPFLCQRLCALGADVRRISVIPDDKELIAQEIRSLSTKVRWIVTAGGVGPTHDDVTYDGIAAAFDLSLERNETLAALIRKHFKKSDDDDLSTAEEKLATVPAGSTIILSDPRDSEKTEGEALNMKPGAFPVVVCQNVLILPGIPILLQRAFNCIRHLFENGQCALLVRCLYVKRDELAFAEHLSSVAEEYRRRVVIGSYPDLTNNYYRVKVTFESNENSEIEAAMNQFTQHLPVDSYILDCDLPGDIIAEAEDRIYNFAHPSEQLRSKVALAIQVTETAVKQFSHDNIAICFTGGKDCTVVLHILHAVLKRIYSTTPHHLLAMQLSTFEPFAEVEQFIDETKRRYGFQFESYIGSGMKESLSKFVEDYPHVKAVFMGTRRNDPSAAKLNHIQKTDPGWPELVRVSPILDWTYADVWNFIRFLHLPYCSLYDRGYTSLGNPSTTHPNRLLLARSSSTSLLRYRPAFELEDETAERAGRDAPPPSAGQSSQKH